MCYRVSTPNPDALQKHLKKEIDHPELYKEYFHVNCFTNPYLPTLTSLAGQIEMKQWKTADLKYKTFNSRNDKIFKSKRKDAARCLIWVTGFFEYHTQGKDKEEEKFPFYIYLKDEPIFAMGGLMLDGGVVSIITTEANELMGKIHNAPAYSDDLRMPLIISPEKYASWLRDNVIQKEVEDLMLPFDPSKMSAHPVSKLLTAKKVNTNVPEVSIHHEYENLLLKL